MQQFNVWEVKTVMSTHRQAAAAAGFLALSLAASSLHAQTAQIQRGGPPSQDTPYILVAAFHSTDRQLGVQAADEVRKRIAGEHGAKELFVVPKTNINATLEASGYRPDSALNASDLMELAKQLHGEYVVDGTATKTPTGVRIDARVLSRTGTQTLAQPLPPSDGKDAGDAAKLLERTLTDALKAMPAYALCTKALRANKYDDAAKEARLGLVAYPNSALNRLCLLSAYSYNKAPADSIISVANAVLAIDPTSVLALSNAAEAYGQKGEKDKAIEYNLRIYRADPTNTTVVPAIIQGLAQSGAPDKALPIIDSLLANNPGDPQMLHTKWLLLLKAGKFKQAMAAGDEYVKADTVAASLDFFQRQIGAAQQDSNTTAVQLYTARAAQKFPQDASLQILLAQTYRKQGQLQQALDAALRAATLEPKNANAWLFAIVTANDMNQPDTAMALAKRAVAGGADKEALGQALLAPVGAAVKKAQESKTREDWAAALKSAQSADAIAASPATKFYIGLSSFQIGLDALQNAQKVGAEKAKDSKANACAEAKVAEDQWATAQVAMPAGGSYNTEAAGSIMGNIQKYADYIPQMKKAYCGK